MRDKCKLWATAIHFQATLCLARKIYIKVFGTTPFLKQMLMFYMKT